MQLLRLTNFITSTTQHVSSMTVKRNLKALLVFLFTLFLISSLFLGSAVHAQEREYEIEQQVDELTRDSGSIIGETIIVKYSNTPTKSEVEADFSNNFGLFSEAIDGVEVALVKEDTALVRVEDSDIESELKKALSKPNVEFAQPLYRYVRFDDYNPISNPSFTNQWYLQSTPSGINLPTAWGKVADFVGITCGSDPRCGGLNTTKIAVIDSGVNLDGTEIASNSVNSANAARFFYNNDNTCLPGEFYETLNLGAVASPLLINFCRNIGSHPDDDGHGTTVASSIIMENNSSNGVGVAYNTTLLPVALNGPFSYNSFIVGEAIIYAVDQGVKVINLSMGTSVDDTYLRQAINYAYSNGVTVVASSGNCGNKTAFTCGLGGDNLTINPRIYPAEYPQVISVGASNFGASIGAITRSTYSSFGASLDVVTGVGESSVSPFGVHGMNESGSYTTANTGTSFSAPVVAGVAGLAYTLNPDMKPWYIYDALTRTAKDINVAGFDNQTGFGLVDSSAFVTYIINHYRNWDAPLIEGGALSDITQQSFNGRLIQSLRGTDNGLYTRHSEDGITFSGWTYSSVTLDRVSMIEFDGRLYQAARGAGGVIRTRSSVDGVTWSNWSDNGGAASPITMNVFAGRLVQSIQGTDNGIYTRSTADGNTWSPWVLSGGTMSEIFTQVFAGRLIQSIRGTDNGIYTRSSTDGLSWSGWEYSGATSGGISFGVVDNRLVQSIRGTNNGIYTRSSINGITWTGWELSGLTLQDISMKTIGTRLVQSVRGTDNGIYVRSSANGINWTNWNLNGLTQNPIRMESVGNRLYQSVRGTDGLLYVRISVDGVNWALWVAFTPANSTPTIIEFEGETVMIYRGGNNEITRYSTSVGL